MAANKIIALALLSFLTAACTPTVKVEAPDKPIEINMNIKIEQEVRVKVEKDLEDMFANDPELFGTQAPASTEGKAQ
jgi:hypothetical protein